MTRADHEISADRLAQLSASHAAEVASRRARVALGATILAVAVVLGGIVGEVDPVRLAENAHRLPAYLVDLAPSLSWHTLGDDLAEWFWDLDRWVSLLFDTLLIAYLGTIVGVVGALLLCFAAAANLERRTLVRGAARRLLEFCRTVPEVVFALLFVIAFGLGAMPGVLAIAIHSTGALGKLFAEVVENIDMKPVEGAVAAGAGRAATIRFAVLPQVLASFASYALLRFEINVRGAAVMGFVGAGGIGQELMVAIRKFYYTDVSAILTLVVVTIMIIDLVTEKARHRLLGTIAADAS